MYTIVLIVAAIILYALMAIFNKKNGKRHFPEPPARKVFGHMFDVKSSKECINFLSKCFKKHGKTVQFRFGPSFARFINVVLTKDYKLAELVLSNNIFLTKAITYRWMNPWLRNGLLTSDGPYWRRHRKILTPAFHFEILKNFVNVFETVGDKLIENLENYDGAHSVDIHSLVALCTLDIICETAMGTKINAQNGENSQYVKSVEEESRIIMERCYHPLKIFDKTFWLTRDYYIQKEAIKILHGFSSNVIDSRKRDDIQKKNDGKLNFLDLLLKYTKEEKMSIYEVQEEVDTIMFEGHDTTATAISFTLYCLANHQEIQNKVLQEQKNLFANEKNPVITFKELQNMKYLEMVIKESLRLYPPVPMFARYSHEDIEFEGHIIPKGTNIGIFVFGIHRNEEYFPEPEKFNPDRFAKFSPLPFTYLPFSAGPRNCIGQKFAMLELKSVISKIIRHFEVQTAIPTHELQLVSELTLTSINGIKVGLVKRV